LTGFLPASQLSAEHYPKIAGGDSNRITSELEKLVGEKFDVQIITADPQENKLVFSEKSITGGNKSTTSRRTKVNKSNNNMLEKYSIGEETDVEVVGIVDFGLFVKLPEGDEGLIHISEIS
jgi:small subunit ribosomal protein S1